MEEINMKDSNITIRISAAEKDRLKSLAAEKDIPISQIIREAIREYLQKNYSDKK